MPAIFGDGICVSSPIVMTLSEGDLPFDRLAVDGGPIDTQCYEAYLNLLVDTAPGNLLTKTSCY